MDAFRMKARTDEARAAKEAAVQAATQGATEVPLEVLGRIREALDLAGKAARHGNPNARSDAGVAAALFRSGAEGAAMNVLINLAGITDKTWARDKADQASALLDEVRKEADDVVNTVMEKLQEEALQEQGK
jgi:glutamate formiminotransferase/formiminotetrahydrofolate cyclodeaminase